jgi:hypothetical protein
MATVTVTATDAEPFMGTLAATIVRMLPSFLNQN